MDEEYIIRRLSEELREILGIHNPANYQSFGTEKKTDAVEVAITRAFTIGQNYSSDKRYEYRVLAIDKDGRPQRFKSIDGASKKLGINDDDIYDVMFGYKVSAGGYKFKMLKY